MTTFIIIALCILTLLAYLFDLSTKKLKIPGIILLMLLGVGVRLACNFFSVDLPDLTIVLKVIGTIGLIMIVLEGSLDLELRKEKLPIIRDTFLAAGLLFLVCSLTFAWAFMFFFHTPFIRSLINAIPFSIISSAVAISGVSNLHPEIKEFVVYESSFSDIIGILAFNFFTLNSEFGAGPIVAFLFQLFFFLIISAVTSFGLGVLLHKLQHHVKIIPVIAILLLLYAAAKIFHLPSLILILVFGVLFNNITLVHGFTANIPRLYTLIAPESIVSDITQFKQLVGETTFLIRSFFFILFGYYAELSALLNVKNLIMSLGIIGFILVSRLAYFRIRSLPLEPVVFVAPRGLITILLFLSIAESQRIPQINEGFLFQIVFLTAAVMMFGLMHHKKNV